VTVEIAEVERGAGRVQVRAPGVGRDLPQRLLVEPRLHDLAVAVLHIAAAFRGNQLAFTGPDPDGVDLHAALARVLRRLLDAALVILAVGDEDERLVLALTALEGVERNVDRSPERRAAARDDADVERGEALGDRAVVERQRALHEGTPGEGDEPDTVA